ncbi:MAG TPA: hypothetical protein VJL78_09450 [Candidatus Nitrosocosmicus sp.]|jgi:glycosyltransferase involved in cell wall biosynthesis|nr:hypothetical protein [Candidatus Nitrosocosmicus sp.]
MGHDVKVMRRFNYDPYGIYEFYNELVCFIPEEEFLDTCLREANMSDIVHIHSRIDAFFYLHKKMRQKPRIVMHFHGTDVRGITPNHKKWPPSDFLISYIKNHRKSIIRKRSNATVEKLADKVLVSTPDLVPLVKKGSILLHNPVDTEHFDKKQSHRPIKRAFTFATESTSDKDWIIDFCKKNGLGYVMVIDRTKNPIVYSQMPVFLRGFETYVDIRYINNQQIKSYSKTALESLACGLTVIDHDLKVIQGLPEQHNPINVVQKLEGIYEEVIKTL